jgi:hypothetical protein
MGSILSHGVSVISIMKIIAFPLLLAYWQQRMEMKLPVPRIPGRFPLSFSAQTGSIFLRRGVNSPALRAPHGCGQQTLEKKLLT